MDPSSKGRLTRSKSQSRTPSPHPTGAAATPSVTTPSHRTDRPWNEVTKGGSTPRDAALAPPNWTTPSSPPTSSLVFVPQMMTRPTTGHDARQNSSRQATSPTVRTSLFPRVSTGIYSHSRLGIFLHRRPLLQRALCPPGECCWDCRASGDDAGERDHYHGSLQYRDHHVIAAGIYVRGSDGRD